MDDATKALIRELYDVVVKELETHPDFTPEQALRSVAWDWSQKRPRDFRIMIKLFEADCDRPELWTVPEPRYPVYGSSIHKITEQVLKPFSDLDLGFDRFGDGDSFFDIFEHPDAGLRSPWDGEGEPPDDDYRRLLTVMDERDTALKARSSSK